MKDYFVLISRPAPSLNVPSPEIEQKAYQMWGVYLQKLMQAGQLVSTNQLEYEGKKITGKGKPVELVSMDHETAIGWMVIKADDYDHALEIAQDVPTIELWGGTCEIRPVVKF
jgi:hypothetical protein